MISGDCSAAIDNLQPIINSAFTAYQEENSNCGCNPSYDVTCSSDCSKGLSMFEDQCHAGFADIYQVDLQVLLDNGGQVNTYTYQCIPEACTGIDLQILQSQTSTSLCSPYANYTNIASCSATLTVDNAYGNNENGALIAGIIIALLGFGILLFLMLLAYKWHRDHQHQNFFASLMTPSSAPEERVAMLKSAGGSTTNMTSVMANSSILKQGETGSITSSNIAAQPSNAPQPVGYYFQGGYQKQDTTAPVAASTGGTWAKVRGYGSAAASSTSASISRAESQSPEKSESNNNNNNTGDESSTSSKKTVGTKKKSAKKTASVEDNNITVTAEPPV